MSQAFAVLGSSPIEFSGAQRSDGLGYGPDLAPVLWGALIGLGLGVSGIYIVSRVRGYCLEPGRVVWITAVAGVFIGLSGKCLKRFER